MGFDWLKNIYIYIVVLTIVLLLSILVLPNLKLESWIPVDKKEKNCSIKIQTQLIIRL